MLGWIKKKIINNTTDVMKDEIVRFIAGLRGASDFEVANMILLATIERINLQNSGIITPAALDFSIPRNEKIEIECSFVAHKMVGKIQEYQKSKKPDRAFGVMIWLHSVRALNVAEIRLYGRQLWAEIERGEPYINDVYCNAEEDLTGAVPPDFIRQMRFVPVGLEPRM